MDRRLDDIQSGLGLVWKDLSYEVQGRTPDGELKECGRFEDLNITGSGVLQDMIGSTGSTPGYQLVLRLQTKKPAPAQAMCWRLILVNHLLESIRLEWIALAGLIKMPPRGDAGRIGPTPDSQGSGSQEQPIKTIEFLHNGWQSWSYAGWKRLGAPIPRTKLGRFTRPMQEAQGFPSGAEWDEQAYSEMYTILRDRSIGNGVVAGYLSQRQAFGRIYMQERGADISLTFVSALDRIELAPDQSFTTDWVWLERISSVYPGGGDAYFKAVGEDNQARYSQEVPVGWCSWYTLFTGVTQSDIDQHVAWSEEYNHLLPLDLIQIDDGFQVKVGDWYTRTAGFPDPLRLLADRIRQSGKQPGLWLAPFLADRRSRLVQGHPEWVLRHTNDTPVNPGWGWDAFPRVLDITHPEVLDFLADLVSRVTGEWGYTYLKLDFLYAGALPGNFFNPALTRAQAMTAVLGRIREAVGDQVKLIGCGCPIGSGIGIFDGMRIGPDVAPHWKPRLGLLSHWVREDPGLPAARNAIRNTVLRTGINRRWWINDPDCVLLRAAYSALSESEVKSLISAVALSGGSAIFSDRMMDLPEVRLHWGGRILPPLDIQHETAWSDQDGSLYTLAVPLEGAVGRWILLGVFNLGDRPEFWDPERFMNATGWQGEVHCLDFWAEEYHSLVLPKPQAWTIPARSVRCVALRPSQPSPEWLGSTLHFSQGQEIQSWNKHTQEVVAHIGFEARDLLGKFWVAFPGQLMQATMAGKELFWAMIQPGLYRFEAKIQGVQEARFFWSEG